MSKKKSAAQLDREIAVALTSPESSTTPRSAKALSTLAIMGTEPSQWRLTPIDWVELAADDAVAHETGEVGGPGSVWPW